jgi:serine/threonine-protein kinase
MKRGRASNPDGETVVLLEKLLGKTPWLARMRRQVEGATKLGHYELLHPLGAGGMAEVFKARAVGPGGFERHVVIKRILPAYGRDDDFVRMFADEARILGLVNHPNVVQALEFGEDDGTLFLALEYVEGPSLSRILRALRAANRRMPPAVAGYIAREICRALDCVHRLEDETGVRLEVIHRDVTPSNVIVTPWGGVKLLDFGVAKFASAVRSTREGTVKGKPAYLAPEQLQGKPIDGRVDLFALGIVMHEMLSLQHLFTGESDLQTAKKIMEMKIPRLRAHRADVPEELERIVMRALERDRRKRFATAAEMARALDDFVVGSKLHLDEVGSFVRQIEAISPLARPLAGDRRGAPGAPGQNHSPTAPPEEGAPTVKEFGFGRGRWRFRPSGSHLAAAVGLTLAVLGLTTAFGLRVSTAAEAPPAASVSDARR